MVVQRKARVLALYQLHLVKAETARAFIPKELKLVEAFGYTLGGFFLAHYDDSPVGMLDELVVIAGIVWNPPTSCAWAARVLVSSQEACVHGRKYIGLPSHVAGFSKRIAPLPLPEMQQTGNGFLNRIGWGKTFSVKKNHLEIEVTESDGSAAAAFCCIHLPSAEPQSKSDKKLSGPAIRLSLPSFSGKTIYNPQLLKYSCQILCSLISWLVDVFNEVMHLCCRVRPVEPAKISGPDGQKVDEQEESSDNSGCNFTDSKRHYMESDATRSISVLMSKPILALAFDSLIMQVEAPTLVLPHLKEAGAF